jgi:dimethylamine monooxygenase subunit A
MTPAGRAPLLPSPAPFALPPAIVPFAVSAPYRVRPDVARLGHLPAHVDDPGPPTLLRLDDGAPRALAAALGELAAGPDAVRWVDPAVDPARWWAIAVAVAAAWAADGDPRVALAAPDALDLPWLGVRLRRGGAVERRPLDARTPPALAALAPAAADALERLPPAARPLDALRLAVAEDLVVLLRERPGDGGRAAYLLVAAASGWDPGALGNASFADLHRPVPHAAPLLAAAAALADAMVERGPFVRYVWSLAADDALSHHPRRHPARPLDASAPATWWYRAERQTTLPLAASNASLFAIRVLHAPLAAVATTPARRASLSAAVASMDASMLAYKGLTAAAPALLDWLAQSGSSNVANTDPVATTSSVSRS